MDLLLGWGWGSVLCDEDGLIWRKPGAQSLTREQRLHEGWEEGDPSHCISQFLKVSTAELPRT